VITSVAAAVLLKPIGPVQRLVYADSLFMIVNNMAYTLILAYTLDLGARREWLLSSIERLQRQALETASLRLKALSIADPLTGISNRRQFEEDLDRIWHECLTDQRPLGMLIIDIDHFKLYNDRQGHPAGDACLKQVAALISQVSQADKGLAARLGGEEFGVTVSVGVASLVPQPGVDLISLFATADKALYAAKRAGRNRVVGPRGDRTGPAHARPAPERGKTRHGLIPAGALPSGTMPPHDRGACSFRPRLFL
jgi:GGDEF domain-containing protein